MLFEQFKNCEEMSLEFTYNIEKDGENKITYVLLADYNFHTSYDIFGNVVTFDITYKINCSRLIFFCIWRLQPPWSNNIIWLCIPTK